MVYRQDLNQYSSLDKQGLVHPERERVTPGGAAPAVERPASNGEDLAYPIPVSEKDACGVGFIYRKERKRSTIDDAINALCKMEHRGACGADGITGDGAGILTSIPVELLESEGIGMNPDDALAVIFTPRKIEADYQQLIQQFLQVKGYKIKAWRTVPVQEEKLGKVAREHAPIIEHLIISRAGSDRAGLETEKELRTLRASLSSYMQSQPGGAEFYIASLSSKTIVYKAMTSSQGLAAFYDDLRNENFASNWAVFHRRFSTNTVSKWSLAQPFRLIAHNGEINTLRGNLNWFHARQKARSLARQKDADACLQTTNPDWAGSDSSMLDYAVECLINDGDCTESAFMKLIPEAHEHHSHLKDTPQIEHFYEFFAPHQEPWDGPALVVYSDGNSLGAVLDRNGLRPARFTVYEDGTIILASEAGINIDTNARVQTKGRLGPGQMMAIDLQKGELRNDIEIKSDIATRQPYGQWLLRNRRALKERPYGSRLALRKQELVQQQIASGYSLEDVDQIISSMVLNESEPIFSMGDDTPLAVLSARPKPLFNYFKQRFAQVTNPPIDPIRERLVMSLNSYLGARGERLQPLAGLAETILLPSPILNEAELSFIEGLQGEYNWARCSMTFAGMLNEQVNGAVPSE